MNGELTLGPVLFHWPAEKWRDFYFRMAEESPVSTVFIGEIVCAKRAPFYAPHYEEVAERLEKCGKKVIFSTLGEVAVRIDRKFVRGICEIEDRLVEANDASALWHLSGRRHAIGPFMNVYNEDTLSFLAGKGANRFCLPAELPRGTLAALGSSAKKLGVVIEVQVFGRIPLALSARCYHARAHGRTKDSCQFVCEQDPDGMELRTLSNLPFLAINGIQTLSYGCQNLVQELKDLQDMGIGAFRLSPHTCDMVEVSRIFHKVLARKLSVNAACAALRETAAMPFSNGFYHHVEGFRWIEKKQARA